MENTTKKSMKRVSKHANLVLLFVALVSFCFLGYFKSWYYQELFSIKFGFYPALICGAVLASMIEGGRFAFMLSSASDLIHKNYKGFWFGLSGSAGLFIYEMFLCGSLGHYWNAESSIYTGIFRFIAVLGAIIELRLCLMLTEENKKTEALENESEGDDPESILLEALKKIQKPKK